MSDSKRAREWGRCSLPAIAVSCVIVLGTGCVSGRGSQAQEPVATVPPSTSTPSPIRAEEPPSEVLASVSEFLDRTKEYRVSSAARPADPSLSTARQASGGTSDGPPIVPVEPGPNQPSPQPPSQVVPEPREPVMANVQVSLTDRAPSRATLARPVLDGISFRMPSDQDPAPATPSAFPPTVNQPQDASAASGNTLVEPLVSHLRRQASDGRDLEAEWSLRLVQLAVGREQEAAQLPSTMAGDTRALLDAMVGVILAARSVLTDPTNAGTQALERADAFRRLLAERVDPQIANVALCRKVLTFGAYDEMAPTDLVAGRPVQTIVYSEIRNLHAESTDDGRYRSRVGTRLEILTADGRSIWQHEEPEIVDLCRRPRTDFFIAQRVTVPPTVGAGDYVLKVTVEDKLSQRVDEKNVPFKLAVPGSVAKGP